jgi:hypothetical protein
MEKINRLITVNNYNQGVVGKFVTPPLTSQDVSTFISSDKFIQIDGRFFPTRYIDDIIPLSEACEVHIMWPNRDKSARRSYIKSMRKLIKKWRIAEDIVTNCPFLDMIQEERQAIE